MGRVGGGGNMLLGRYFFGGTGRETAFRRAILRLSAAASLAWRAALGSGGLLDIAGIDPSKNQG